MRSFMLSILDFIFVLLVIALGIVLISVFSDESNRQTVVSALENIKLEEISLDDFPIDVGGAVPVITEVPDLFHIERKNLVEELPLPTALPQPAATPDPVVYRNEVILRARHFANTLESFFQVNEQVRGDPDLVNDAEWRRETGIRLDQFAAAGWELGKVSPAPPENAALQDILAQIGPAAQSMRDNYLEGISTASPEKMKAAGVDLDSIYTIMAQVESEMVRAGWQP